MSEYSVSISIVTYNSEKYIGALLDSIFRHVHGVNYQIYVIDNQSTDKTLDIIAEKSCPFLTLIQCEDNVGFGQGHNKILDMISSKYHICINPDIIIESDVISQISDYLDKHDDIGLLTPKVLFPDGSLQILPKRNPKLKYLLARRLSFGFLKKYRSEFEMREISENNVFDIEFCTGCFMFMRSELFIKVGGFDERYFMYFEDADITRSIRHFSRAQYNPNFIVYHRWERASDKSLKFLLIQIVSMLKYMHKWRYQE